MSREYLPGVTVTQPSHLPITNRSPGLFIKHRKEMEQLGGKGCGRRLYGHTDVGVNDDEFDSYQDAYTWANSYYAVKGRTRNIKDCVDVCANAFGDGTGALAVRP